MIQIIVYKSKYLYYVFILTAERTSTIPPAWTSPFELLTWSLRYFSQVGRWGFLTNEYYVMFQEFNRFFVEAVYGNFRYSAKLCWAPCGLSTNTDSIWHLYFCQKSVFVPWLCLTQLYGRWDLSRWSTLGSVSPKYDGIRSFSIWWILTVSDFRCAWFPGPNTSVGGSLNWYIASRWGGRRFTGFLFAFFHQP